MKKVMFLEDMLLKTGKIVEVKYQLLKVFYSL